MDLEQHIDWYLDKKGLSKKAAAVQKSILQTFSRWQQANPSKSFLENARRYRDYLDSHELYTVGSRAKRCRLVENFCEYLADEDQIEMISYRDNVLGKGELTSILAPKIDAKEMARFFRIQTKKGWRECRDAAIAVLAYCCCLGPSEIAALRVWDVRLGTGVGGSVAIPGGRLPMAQLANSVMHVYLRGRPNQELEQPLFVRTKYDVGSPMSSAQVRTAMKEFAETFGYEYDELFHCSPQLIIAQHIENLGIPQKKRLAASAIGLYFGEEIVDLELFTHAPGNIADALWKKPEDDSAKA